MNTEIKRALILSYSPVARDPRVLRQIKWLTDEGFQIDLVGLGSFESYPECNFFQISTPPLFARLITYAFKSSQKRFEILIRDAFPEHPQRELESDSYQVVILNDLDFVPLNLGLRTQTPTRIHLDLHEFFPGIRGSITWYLLHRRYLIWQLRTLQNTLFDSYTTVSDDICKAYLDAGFNFPFKSLPNFPRESYRNYSPHNSNKIRLIYHGNLGMGRPVPRLIFSMFFLDQRFELNLMVMASKSKISMLKLFIGILGLKKRVHILPTVKSSDIIRSILEFDVGVCYFSPISASLNLALPNKFFESVVARLFIFTGPSKSLRPIVEQFEIGVACIDWSFWTLISTLRKLDRQTIEAGRQNTKKVEALFSIGRTNSDFLKTLNLS